MNDWEMFQQWLEEHNYCKVTRCRDCWFWGDDRTDREYRFPSARCRRHKVDTYHDDFCSDAVEIRKGVIDELQR